MKQMKVLSILGIALGVLTIGCVAESQQAPDTAPPASLDALLGETFVNAEGKTIGAETLADKEVIALYFSAVWCPPCRAFTPRLVEAANELREAGKPFEIIFVSSDRSADAMQGYMQDYNMPWLAIPFGDAKIRELGGRYGIRGIPALVVIDGDGNTITTQGRNDIASQGAKAYDKWVASE